MSILASNLVPSELTSSAVSSLAITNVIFAVLMVLGAILDFKKILQFTPSLKLDGEEGGKAQVKNEAHQVPNDSILENTMNIGQKGPTPVSGVEMKQMKYAIDSPDEEEKKSESLGTDGREDEEEEKKEGEAADLQDVKLQMDDVVGF